MKFPVNLKHDKNDGGFVVTFPDIPEAITQGNTVEEALAMAHEALETALRGLAHVVGFAADTTKLWIGTIAHKAKLARPSVKFKRIICAFKRIADESGKSIGQPNPRFVFVARTAHFSDPDVKLA